MMKGLTETLLQNLLTAKTNNYYTLQSMQY